MEEYFQDFDPLRSGAISKSHFRRGLSSLGQHQLTDAQFEVISLNYADPKRVGNVLWTRFLNDIEQGNILRNVLHLNTFKMICFKSMSRGETNDRFLNACHVIIINPA